MGGSQEQLHLAPVITISMKRTKFLFLKDSSEPKSWDYQTCLSTTAMLLVEKLKIKSVLRLSYKIMSGHKNTPEDTAEETAQEKRDTN